VTCVCQLRGFGSIYRFVDGFDCIFFDKSIIEMQPLKVNEPKKVFKHDLWKAQEIENSTSHMHPQRHLLSAVPQPPEVP